MTYQGPTEANYTNVRALNGEFLRLVRTSPMQVDLDDAEQASLLALGRQQTERLASTPFLLFSIQENDRPMWQKLLLGEDNADLFRKTRAATHEISNLLTATMGFLWLLAQSNPYAARLISGAGPDWCEMIAALTSHDLVSCIAHRSDLISPRRAAGVDIWAKLLDSGVTGEKTVRRAAHLAVLQTLLTTYPHTSAIAWPLAARKTNIPYSRVADDPVKT